MHYLCLLAALGGCNTPTYLSEKRPLETMPAAMGGGYQADTDLYVLPVRRPSNAEKSALAAQQRQLGLQLPVPWAAARDFSIEVEWSVKNLEAKPVRAFFTLNGGNEFGDYVPSLYIDPTQNPEDQTPPPPLVGGELLELAANEVRLGVWREDQLDEAALDLEAITRYPDPAGVIATPFQVITHNSTASRVGLENVPANDVTPAMVRFQFVLTSDAHVSAEYNVRVREHADKLAQPAAKNLYVSTVAMLPPPAAPPQPAAPAKP
jgi:hypothetical protein